MCEPRVRFSPLIAALPLVGCLHVQQLSVLPTPEPGLQLFPTARAFDAPGQVIRIDRHGVMHHVTDLSRRVAAPQNPEAIPVMFREMDLRAGLVLSFLSGSTSFGAQAARHVRLSMSVVGAKREIAQEMALDSALRPVLPSITFEDGSRYYVISETVLADSIAFKINSNFVDSLGGIAKIKNIIQANPRLSMSDSTATALQLRLVPAMRVFYKVMRIDFSRGVSPMVTLVRETTNLDVAGEDRTP